MDINAKKEKEKYLNTIDNDEKCIKNINIFFDKNKGKQGINNNKTNIKLENIGNYISSSKSKEENGYSAIQKYSIRNKYKMRRNLENI